jgi:hypothetical protein
VSYTIPKNVITRQLGEELVLVDLESGQYYTLNPTGTLVWENLPRFENVAALSQFLADSADADVAKVRDDVEELIRELVGRKLLVKSCPS